MTGCRLRRSNLPLTDLDEMKNLNQPNFDFYLYGRIEYEDIYGAKQWVDYSYTTPGYTLHTQMPLVPSTGGNDAS